MYDSDKNGLVYSMYIYTSNEYPVNVVPLDRILKNMRALSRNAPQPQPEPQAAHQHEGVKGSYECESSSLVNDGLSQNHRALTEKYGICECARVGVLLLVQLQEALGTENSKFGG